MSKFSRIVIATAIFMGPPAGALLAQGTPGSGTSTTASPSTTTDKGTAKKKPAKKMTRQQEIDQSIDSGTVPSRYRNSVPQEYQHYVPFAK